LVTGMLPQGVEGPAGPRSTRSLKIAKRCS
jgi:hypothetical protein